MENFKEAYQDDLDNAFFDEEEFADRHTIDGEECVIILIDMASAAASSGRSAVLNPQETAINKIRYIVFVRDAEVIKLGRKKFTSGAMISLDGKKYFLQDVKHSAGVYRLEIGIHAV